MMRTPTLLTVLLVAAVMAPVPSHAGVKVNFIDPQRYTDAGSSHGARNAILDEFRAYLEKLGDRFLKPSQSLLTHER